MGPHLDGPMPQVRAGILKGVDDMAAVHVMPHLDGPMPQFRAGILKGEKKIGKEAKKKKKGKGGGKKKKKGKGGGKKKKGGGKKKRNAGGGGGPKIVCPPNSAVCGEGGESFECAAQAQAEGAEICKYSSCGKGGCPDSTTTL